MDQKHDEWELLKKSGSEHYKSGGVEPIDLYKSGGMLQDFAIASIIKYAYRNRGELARPRGISVVDMNKIHHYASLLIALKKEEETKVDTVYCVR